MKNCNLVLVLIAVALCSSPVASQDLPKLIRDADPLPERIVEAWKHAGAQTGWMSDGPLNLLFQPERSIGPRPSLPAFRFGDAWRVGLLAKLPAPATPFGLSFANMTDAGLKDLPRLTSLQMLDVRNTNVTNAGLKELVPLKNLQSLKLGVRATAKGLKDVAGLKNLKALYVIGSGVTDEELKELDGLKNLQRLSVRDALVTDKGMKALSGFGNLKMLDLYNTKVTDVGLKELATMKGLKTLELTKSQVTELGVRELQGALPGCKISFRQKK